MIKPRVIILMATYNPNISWLEEQLVSINDQTYEPLELIVCDDCSTSITGEQLEALLKQFITRFPVRLIKNETNLGSNKTFERLTLEACSNTEQLNETFIAYCDQDDIWEVNKLAILLEAASRHNAVLAYSDMSIIDGSSKMISDSITKVRKRFTYFEGNELWRRILVRNFISGCCMIIRADIAKAAVPFEYKMQHDRWLSVCASIQGYIAFVNKPLVRYRQHGMNQTGVLKGIANKEEYYNIRLRDHLQLLKSIRERNSTSLKLSEFLDNYITQMEIRCKYAKGDNRLLFRMLRLMKYNKATIFFEVIAMRLPDYFFKKLLDIIISKNI